MKTPKPVYQIAVEVALGALLLLILPLLAMMFTDEMNWDVFDFIVMFVLLFGAGFSYRLIARKIDNLAYKAAVGATVGTGLFLLWSNLAVGLVGGGSNIANLMVPGVLVVGFVGAVIARFQPRGMASALFATAAAQGLVAVVSFIAGLHNTPGISELEIVGVNGFFIALWVGSGFLFWFAGQQKETHNTSDYAR